MHRAAITTAEPLTAVARRAYTELNPAADARQQSPGLLGGQARTEVRSFLDDTHRDERHRSSVAHLLGALARRPELLLGPSNFLGPEIVAGTAG